MPPQARVPRSTWIEAGLQVLASGGPDAVRIEPLAKELGVTRGGFYWHFRGRDDLLEAMLETWEQRATEQTVEQVEREGGEPEQKVRRAGMLTFSRSLAPIDLAVREWARRDKSVARRLRRVDNRRMEYLRSVIGTVVADPAEVEARSLLAFSLAIGNQFVAAGHPGRTRREVLDRALRRVLD